MSQRSISNLLSGLICLLLAVLTILVLVQGKGGSDSSDDFSAGPADVRTLKVNTIQIFPESSYDVQRTYNGVLKSGEAVDLAFDRSGRVSVISAQPGDSVEKGDMVVKLTNKVELDAPFDGIIAAKRTSVGSIVSPGVPVMRIVKNDKLEAWFNLPDSVAQAMSTEEEYDLTIGDDTYSIAATGKLPELDSSGRTRSIYFNLSEDISKAHRTGEVVKLEVTRNNESEGFWLPLSALSRETRGLWSVFVVTDGIVTRHFVEIIHLEDDQAWCTGTLDGDATIIKNGTHRVVPGQRVEPITE